MSAPTNNFERRAFEVRVDLSEDRKIRGTAIVFNSQSVNLGGFYEYVAPSAVDRTLRDALDVRALVDHDSSKVLGRTKAGTLQLRKTKRGLESEIDPPNTTYARDILESVSRGDVSGMSFGFVVLDEEWNFEETIPQRTILDMTIAEVSVVSFPAYSATDVTVAKRSLDMFIKSKGPTKCEIDRRLRLAR